VGISQSGKSLEGYTSELRRQQFLAIRGEAAGSRRTRTALHPSPNGRHRAKHVLGLSEPAERRSVDELLDHGTGLRIRRGDHKDQASPSSGWQLALGPNAEPNVRHPGQAQVECPD
jgi:hypothetical protein